MVSEVGKIAGFIDPKSGQIRDKKQLAKADQELQSKSTETEATEVIEGQTLGNALGQVRTRSSEQLNSAISLVRSAQDDVSAAKQNVKQRKQVLTKLEDAIKTGDTETAEKLRTEFSKLESDGAKLEEQIETNNQERRGEGAKSVRFGNKEIVKVSVDDVKFESSTGEVDLNDLDSIRAAKSKLKDEREALGEQSNELSGKRSELRTAQREIDNEITRIKKVDQERSSDAIRSFDLAKQTAEGVAKELLGLGTKSLDLNNLDPSVVEQLVQ